MFVLKKGLFMTSPNYDLAAEFLACVCGGRLNGVTTDLNTLIPPDSALQLMSGESINSGGEITEASTRRVWSRSSTKTQAVYITGICGPLTAPSPLSTHRAQAQAPAKVPRQLPSRISDDEHRLLYFDVSHPAESMRRQMDEVAAALNLAGFAARAKRPTSPEIRKEKNA